MYQGIKAVIDKDGRVHFLEDVHFSKRTKAVVLILNDEDEQLNESALLSEGVLAKDWNRPEEDEAWAHLQSGE